MLVGVTVPYVRVDIAVGTFSVVIVIVAGVVPIPTLF